MVSTLRRAVPLALATVFLTASVALAGNGTTVTHFAASYPALGYGPMIDCTGNRLVKSGPDGWVKDTETCVTAYPYSPPALGEVYRIVPFTGDNWGDNIWFSDYEGFAWAGPFTTPPCDVDLLSLSGMCFRPAISGVVTVTYSAHTGLYTVSIVAYYAPY